jgi:hypothetical protein
LRGTSCAERFVLVLRALSGIEGEFEGERVAMLRIHRGGYQRIFLRAKTAQEGPFFEAVFWNDFGPILAPKPLPTSNQNRPKIDAKTHFDLDCFF